MHPDLVKLLELQVKDVRLREADKGLDAILAEVKALDQQLESASQAVDQAERAVAEAARRRVDIESKMANYKKLEERGHQRLEQVRSPKEIQAVMTELDLARSVLSKEEGEWLKLADVITALETHSREADRKLQEFRATQIEARQGLDARKGEAELRRGSALADRDSTAAEVNRTLRTRYERLRTVRTHVVVALEGAACGACHTTIPLNRRSQIRAGTLIDACESCGVILYADEAIA